jgi:hypothetical protein
LPDKLIFSFVRRFHFLAGEDGGQGRVPRRASGRSAAESLDGTRSRPYTMLPDEGKLPLSFGRGPDPLFPQQREPVQRRFPMDRSFPLLDHIPQRQVHHFQRRLFAGKSDARLQCRLSPQFIARDFKEFIRISGMTHVRTSPYYPQSNGKIERWHKSLKGECIRPGTPLSLEDARRLVEGYWSITTTFA